MGVRGIKVKLGLVFHNAAINFLPAKLFWCPFPIKRVTPMRQKPK